MFVPVMIMEHVSECNNVAYWSVFVSWVEFCFRNWVKKGGKKLLWKQIFSLFPVVVPLRWNSVLISNQTHTPTRAPQHTPARACQHAHTHTHIHSVFCIGLFSAWADGNSFPCCSAFIWIHVGTLHGNTKLLFVRCFAASAAPRSMAIISNRTLSVQAFSILSEW